MTSVDKLNRLLKMQKRKLITLEKIGGATQEKMKLQNEIIQKLERKLYSPETALQPLHENELLPDAKQQLPEEQELITDLEPLTEDSEE